MHEEGLRDHSRVLRGDVLGTSPPCSLIQRQITAHPVVVVSTPKLTTAAAVTVVVSEHIRR
jgi:hypothetical protein